MVSAFAVKCPHAPPSLGVLEATFPAAARSNPPCLLPGLLFGEQCSLAERSRLKREEAFLPLNTTGWIIVVVAVIFAILAPLCAMVVRFAMSRQREYLADAGAVELTRYPDGLIGALRKLGGCRQPLRHVGQSTAPLFMVNPLKRKVRTGRHDASTVFSTHPPLTDRIQRIQALK